MIIHHPILGPRDAPVEQDEVDALPRPRQREGGGRARLGIISLCG